MKRNITSKSRGPYLTPEEAAIYRAIREQNRARESRDQCVDSCGADEMAIYRDERRTHTDENQIEVSNPEFEANYEIWGAAPVQAIGTAFGRDIYFRARHDEWTFEVADEAGNLPSDGQAGPSGFLIRGKDLNASYMPLREARKIIERGLKDFANRV